MLFSMKESRTRGLAFLVSITLRCFLLTQTMWVLGTPGLEVARTLIRPREILPINHVSIIASLV
jgi:hypothetical protein